MAQRWRDRTWRAEAARWRMAVFQPAPPEGRSISLKTRSIMPSRRSPLLATWLYSDIASTPRTSPSLRMLSGRDRRPVARRDGPPAPRPPALPTGEPEAKHVHRVGELRGPGDPQRSPRVREDRTRHRPDLPAQPDPGSHPARPGRPRPRQGRHHHLKCHLRWRPRCSSAAWIAALQPLRAEAQSVPAASEVVGIQPPPPRACLPAGRLHTASAAGTMSHLDDWPDPRHAATIVACGSRGSRRNTRGPAWNAVTPGTGYSAPAAELAPVISGGASRPQWRHSPGAGAPAGRATRSGLVIVNAASTPPAAHSAPDMSAAVRKPAASASGCR